MYLNEIHNQLISSELRLHAAGEEGVLNPVWASRVNTQVQAALNDINKHFTIRENELLLRTKIGKDIYELIPANAVSSGNPYAFIIDSPENPFKGDIMQIHRVTNSVGESLWLNTDVAYKAPNENLYGIRPHYYVHQGINFLSYNTLKLNQGHDLGDLLVHYKAKFPVFDRTLNPDQIYLDIPDHFMRAITLFVANRFFNPAGAETIGNGMYHEGSNYMALYQAEIKELKENLGSIASQGETTNFYRGGWV